MAFGTSGFRDSIALLPESTVDDVPDHIKQLLKEQEVDKLAELKSPQSEDGKCSFAELRGSRKRIFFDLIYDESSERFSESTVELLQISILIIRSRAPACSDGHHIFSCRLLRLPSRFFLAKFIRVRFAFAKSN